MNPEFLDAIGAVYRKVNTPEICDRMKLLFEEARQRYPTDPRMRLFLGHAYAGTGDKSRARAMYAAAISLAGQEGITRLSKAKREAVAREAKEALK
jgi:hypothetical protein